jgi:hypothetical protein
MFSLIKISIVAVKLWYSKSARKNGYIYVIFNNFCWLLFFFKNSPLLPLRDRLMNNDIFGYNSVNPWRILLIFELDRDLYEIILCTKFHVNRIKSFRNYRVNGRTAGRTHWPILECTHFLSTQKWGCEKMASKAEHDRFYEAHGKNRFHMFQRTWKQPSGYLELFYVHICLV